MKYSHFFCGLFLLLCAASCGNGSRRYFEHDPEPLPVSIGRFDRQFLAVDTADMRTSIRGLYRDFPGFMPFFVEEVLGAPTSDTVYLEESLRGFFADTMFAEVNRRVLETFADVSPLECSIGAAFARLRTFYPDTEVPDIYFFVSGFNNSFLMLPDAMAVGVDMYLGNDYPYYEQVVYNYMRYTMRPECIPVDVVSAYMFRRFGFDMEQNRLLENMIYRGRLMYVVSVLFPDEKPSEVMGYTPEQWQWCVDNERAIWATLLDNRDLFKSDGMTMTKYLNDAPFTSPISQESPGRLGTWLGWRITQSYMENNPDVSVPQLLAERNAQKLLEQSKYKP